MRHIFGAALIGFGFLTTTSGASAGERYWVEFDCNRGIGNEQTVNDVYVEYWHDDILLQKTKSNYGNDISAVFSGVFAASGNGWDFWTDGAPQYGKTWNADYVANTVLWTEGNRNLEPTSVVVRATGDDALFIDYLKFYKEGSDDMDYQAGANGLRGYCLSTDPGDINGDFKDYASGCYPALRFTFP